MLIDYDRLFYSVDNFCKGFEPWYKKQLVSGHLMRRRREGHLTLSEVLTILIAYHQSGMACFKYFYLDLCSHHRHLFQILVHYDRFIALIKQVFPALIYLLKSLSKRLQSTYSLIRHPWLFAIIFERRSMKVFKGLAAKGKTSTGWFFGLKIHLIFNTHGEIVRLAITPGNVNGKTPVSEMVKGITAKLIGDKGYLSQKLFQQLFKSGVTLITKIKRNMKNILINTADKLMLIKRSFIETIFSSLKSSNTLIHHRHRNPINALSHLLAGLINYQIRDDKPYLHTILKLNP